MKLREENGNIRIEDVIDFNIEQTLECGQCFHFDRFGEQEYAVVAYGRLLHVKQEGNTLIFYGKNLEEAEGIWIPYFDLKRDYGEIKQALLRADDKLTEAVRSKYGVRILRQEFYETLLSFIISQNKQIPHIKRIISDLCEGYGKHIGSIAGREYYAFPEPEVLGRMTEEQFRGLKTGFRAPYLVCACEKLNTTLTEEALKGLGYTEAKQRLMEIKGVGEKVANCVLLFGLSYRNAFPVDVWIKRIMEELYFDGKDTKMEQIAAIAKEKFGVYGGYAQQYLFYYGRSMGMGKKKT